MTRAIVWADGGPGVGLGHLGRCCAVGVELRRHAVVTVLLTPDERGAAYARTLGVEAVQAASFDDGLAQQRAAGFDVLLVDSYRLDPADYETARRQSPTLVLFDDEGGEVPRCDVVVNGAPGAEKRPYFRAERTRYLLGARYFPLREAFRSVAPRTVPAAVERVLVTTGGDDVRGVRAMAAAAVRGVYPEARVTVVVGADRAGTLPDIPGCDVVLAPSDYAARVRQADVMVCGAGQTLVEAAASGTPAASLVLSPDQRYQHAAVCAAGACLDAGSWERPADLADGLRSALERLREASLRQALSDRGRALIDGLGASRIAEAVTAGAGAARG